VARNAPICMGDIDSSCYGEFEPPVRPRAREGMWDATREPPAIPWTPIQSSRVIPVSGGVPELMEEMTDAVVPMSLAS